MQSNRKGAQFLRLSYSAKGRCAICLTLHTFSVAYARFVNVRGFRPLQNKQHDKAQGQQRRGQISPVSQENIHKTGDDTPKYCDVPSEMYDETTNRQALKAAQKRRLESLNERFKAAQGSFRLGIIGDLHTHWDNVDVAQFSRSDYDLLFFTGDLGGGSIDSSLRMARLMAALQQPTLVMPGNNDTFDINELAAELAHQRGLNMLQSIVHNSAEERNPELGISLCGYSHHRLHIGDDEVSLLAARPHSMGGPNLSFPEYMVETYGIESIAESAERLCRLVDEVESDRIIFVAHNGPTGLGEQPHDMWGCDFKPGGGDWGDPDLAAAIDYARAQGKSVLAVIAGHMHLRTKQGEQRPWKQTIEGTVYVNAALVPRIFSGKDDVYRHHVVMRLDKEGIEFEEMLVPEYG